MKASGPAAVSSTLGNTRDIGPDQTPWLAPNQMQVSAINRQNPRAAANSPLLRIV